MHEDYAPLEKHSRQQLAERLWPEKTEEYRNMPMMLYQVILHVFESNWGHHWIFLTDCLEQADAPWELVLQEGLV